MIGDAALTTGAGLGFELVDEVDDIEEAPAGTAAVAGAYSTASDRLFQQHPTGCSTGIRPAGGLRQGLHR